jgi:hypothetical protein
VIAEDLHQTFWCHFLKKKIKEKYKEDKAGRRYIL